MLKHKILFGVCGIGSGHTQRQLPLIERFAVYSQIVIFAYDSSFNFFKKYFENNSNITVINVAVPFYVGNSEGIDFEATKNLEINKKDYKNINGDAFAKAEQMLGIPNLVISDYEPISAEFAYKFGVPLITIDQQSKYLAGEFPKELNGTTYADEIARLMLFFPKVDYRMACTFFDVMKKNGGEEVKMFPPILKDSILKLKNVPENPTSILVYFSSQKEFPQNLQEVISLCNDVAGVQFHIFVSNTEGQTSLENVKLYQHGDDSFMEILRTCSGIVTTAGHTLLSEAMYLNIPVYAIPLPVYEQQMNAEVISKNGFGISSETINIEMLKKFITNLYKFREAIKNDRNILLKGNGKEEIIKFIESNYFQ